MIKNCLGRTRVMIEKEKDIINKEDADYSKIAVPESSKKGFMSLFVVMLGFTFFSASMTTGGNLGLGLNLKDFIIAITIGSAILGTYTSLLAYVSSKTGLNFDLLARHAFGNKGSYVPSGVILITQTGWFGVGVAMFAVPVSALLGINPYILIAITGVLMTLTAYYGIKGISIIGAISVPLIAILGIMSMSMGIESVGGIFNVFKESPEAPITFITALTLVIGSFVSGGTATPNFTRFAKNPKIAVITTAIAFSIGNSLMFCFGAVGAAVTGVPDIFDIMIAQGLVFFGIVVLLLNIWTTNNNALYTAGLGLANITKLKSQTMTLSAGALGTISAMWLFNNFVTFLTVLGSALPSIGAIIVLDYFMHKERYFVETGKYAVKWNAVLGVIIGALAGLYIPIGIPPINAMVVGCLIHLIFDKLNK